MLYIVDNDLYDLYNFVDNIVVVAASMINNDICEIIKESAEETFSEVFSDTFSNSFWTLFSSFRFAFSNVSFIFICEAVYGRVIDVATSAHEIRSEGYYVGLHFLEALNRKILWKES